MAVVRSVWKVHNERVTLYTPLIPERIVRWHVYVDMKEEEGGWVTSSKGTLDEEEWKTAKGGWGWASDVSKQFLKLMNTNLSDRALFKDSLPPQPPLTLQIILLRINKSITRRKDTRVASKGPAASYDIVIKCSSIATQV